MMDTTAVFSFAIIVITGMLVAIGAQLFLILREFQRTIQKTNKVLDDTGTVSESISKPISMASSALMGIKGGATLVKMLTNKKGKKS